MNRLELKAERIRHGLTQEAMADKMGMSCCSYNKKENGKADFTGEEINKIIQIFNLDYSRFSAIFLGEGQPKGLSKQL